MSDMYVYTKVSQLLARCQARGFNIQFTENGGDQLILHTGHLARYPCWRFETAKGLEDWLDGYDCGQAEKVKP